VKYTMLPKLPKLETGSWKQEKYRETRQEQRVDNTDMPTCCLCNNSGRCLSCSCIKLQKP